MKETLCQIKGQSNRSDSESVAGNGTCLGSCGFGRLVGALAEVRGSQSPPGDGHPEDPAAPGLIGRSAGGSASLSLGPRQQSRVSHVPGSETLRGSGSRRLSRPPAWTSGDAGVVRNPPRRLGSRSSRSLWGPVPPAFPRRSPGRSPSPVAQRGSLCPRQPQLRTVEIWLRALPRISGARMEKTTDFLAAASRGSAETGSLAASLWL